MKNLFVTLLIAGLCFIASSAWAQTFTVNNVGDSGTGTLRDAIDQLNANAAADTAFEIEFAPGLANQIIAIGTMVNPYAPINVGAGKTVVINPTAVPVSIDGGGMN